MLFDDEEHKKSHFFNDDGVYHNSPRLNLLGHDTSDGSVDSSSGSDSNNGTRNSSTNSEKILFQGFNLNYVRRTSNGSSNSSNSSNNGSPRVHMNSRRRSYSFGSDELNDEYGWFTDFESPSGFIKFRKSSGSSM